MIPNLTVTAFPFLFHFGFLEQSRMSLGSVADSVGAGILLPFHAAMYFFFSDLFLQSSQTFLFLRLFVSVCYLTAHSLQKIVALQFAIS